MKKDEASSAAAAAEPLPAANASASASASGPYASSSASLYVTVRRAAETACSHRLAELLSTRVLLCSLHSTHYRAIRFIIRILIPENCSFDRSDKSI